MNSLEKDGFVIFRNVFSDTEIDLLRSEADRIALDENSACVRHIRSKSELFREVSVCGKIPELIPSHLVPVRSILFDKTPAENWPVAWHQDLTIAVECHCDIEGYGPWSSKDGVIHVQPPVSVLEQMVTARIHLDETPEANGALRVVPGSQRHGKFPHADIISRVQGNVTICECGAGDVLLMAPLILHSSRRSKAPVKRRILHFEYARPDLLDERLRWHESY